MLIKQSGISLALGLLIGFQREWGPNRVAGIRTFGLITVLGTLCAWLSNVYGVWILAAGLMAKHLALFYGLIILGGIAVVLFWP